MQNWLKTPPGQYLLDWEKAQLERVVADIFGYHALQLGLPDLNALEASRIPHRWVASPYLSDGDDALAINNIATKSINTPSKTNLSLSKEHTATDLSFVKVAKNKAFWQQKSVTTSLRTACVGLAGLLFFQVVFSQRNHLAAANPALATSFESICQAVGCKMAPFKNIEAFKIDSSSFQKAPAVAGNTLSDAAQAHAYALKLTLKNSSDIPVAMPAVELTLTEAGDKPVLRRVLLAKDLGFNGATLAANGDWTGEITVAVNANPATAPVSGYRVLLFYP